MASHTNMPSTLEHPCFDRSALHSVGRIHLPVAPRCNISCKYCVRRLSCFNESRPGITASVLSPTQAVDLLEQTLIRDSRIKVAGIAGPGDALANAETFETLKMINKRFTENKPTLCLSTNGLLINRHLKKLLEFGVNALTVTINAVDPMIASKIYRHIYYCDKKFAGLKAAEILISHQLEGVLIAARSGIRVKVNTVMIPGVNDQHIPFVAERVSHLGADRLNIIPVIPQAGFRDIGEPDSSEVRNLQTICRQYIDVMSHCRRCRADAVGLITEQSFTNDNGSICQTESNPESNLSGLNFRDKNERVFAVASKDGVLVDQHFGHADKLFIFSVNRLRISLIETRQITPYCSNSCSPEQALSQTLDKISDCSHLLCMKIGAGPANKIKDAGITPIETYGKIEEVIKAVAKNHGLDEIYRMART